MFSCNEHVFMHVMGRVVLATFYFSLFFKLSCFKSSLLKNLLLIHIDEKMLPLILKETIFLAKVGKIDINGVKWDAIKPCNAKNVFLTI